MKFKNAITLIFALFLSLNSVCHAFLAYSNKELDELDSQLGISYAELKKVFSPNFFKKIIQKSQSNWIKSVNSNFNSTND